MAIEDQGPWVIAVGWIMAAISLVCVALRMYVRIVKVKFFGVDDYVYILAAVRKFFLSRVHVSLYP